MKRLDGLRDVVVGIIEHPQSRISDFYREVGDLFGVPLQAHNRFGGFKAIRARWTEHISTTCSRPVLIFDEAQEVINSVFCELRVLASKDLDSRQLLCVILAGNQRLPNVCAASTSCPSAAVFVGDWCSKQRRAMSCSPASNTCWRPPATRHS